MSFAHLIETPLVELLHGSKAPDAAWKGAAVCCDCIKHTCDAKHVAAGEHDPEKGVNISFRLASHAQP